jgi:hypothetical protein
VIDQAKGILMEQHRVSAEEAFELLRRQSQRENRELRELAEELVDRARQRQLRGDVFVQAGQVQDPLNRGTSAGQAHPAAE